MSIRDARIEDVPQILQLIHDLALYEKAPEEVHATVADLEQALFSDTPHVFAHVVEVDEKVIGIAIWFLNYSTWQGKHGIYLEDLYIDPQYRGQGYGLLMLKHLAKICVDRGYGRFQWWVLDWNSPSIEFYKSQGAVAMDEWTVYRVSGSDLDKLGS
ncbi:MAG: GNAT family N-acetyltransferase [Actinobacteria bacterium]|nr:GNAT family N-acetyltransferase [Actinomycetota bacterium]